MDTGLNSFVVIATVVNILLCFWLLWWNRRTPANSGTETTGHSWDDGEIQEYNKPLPRWWLNMFVLTIIWGLGYLIVYPGLGGYAGTAKWSSEAAHDQEQSAIEARYASAYAPFRAQPIEVLAGNPQAVKLGGSVFANNCAACHGADARGATGFPNLTDADWLYGGDADTLLKTVIEGRTALMPAWQGALGNQGVQEVVAYVESLSRRPENPRMVAAGKAHYAVFCVACHGVDGKGNVALGAPNLSDLIWLYGNDQASLVVSVAEGRQGNMPAHRELLSEDKVRLAVAYVYQLSQPNQSAPSSAVPAP